MKQNKRLFLMLLSVLVCVLSLSILLVDGAPSDTAHAEDNVVVSQKFDGDSVPEGWEDVIESVGDGWALLKQGFRNIPVDASKLVASNNYEVSFDIKADEVFADDVFFFSFVGLGGELGQNIYWKANNNGMYWCISDSAGYHPIYNNSGDMHGGRDGSGVNLTEKHTVKFVHFKGYVELWIDGTCRAVSHLSNLGNNNYDSRVALEEGTITGFSMDSRTNLRIANFVVKEAVGGSTSYARHTDDTNVSSVYALPLAAQNLYNGNFRIRAHFAVENDTLSNYYPSVNVFGLNNSTGTEKNGNHYAVTFQAYADGTYFTPQIFAKKPDTNWASASGEAAIVTKEDGVDVSVEVYGDKINYYVNGTLAISTSFTELGITKGHAQYINVQSGGGGMYWTDISYDGFDKETSAVVTVDKTRAKVGETLTFTADPFGATTDEQFFWYIDGVKQSDSGLTLVRDNLDSGKHIVTYASESFSGNQVTVEVLRDIITITADKNIGYKTDTFVVTAERSGEFAEGQPVWYVDGVAQTEVADDTLSVTDLAVGTHTIVYKNSVTTSNEVTVTVKQSELKIVVAKNNYRTDETAQLTAEVKGIADGTIYTWSVNDTVLEEKTAALNLSMSTYKKGDVLTVKCVADDIEATTTINIYFDPLAEISADKNYKLLNKVELEGGKTYGNYICREDADGNYLESVEANTGSWFSLSGAIPETMNFALSYQMYVPAEINVTNYVYPGFGGLNSKYPQGFVEIAVTVNKDGFAPYIKDQADNNHIYSVEDYGFDVDLSFDSGIAKKGDWNTVKYVVSGKYLAVYINDVQVYFINYPNMMLPSSISFNSYPDGGTGLPYVKYRNIEVYGIAEEVPPVSSVVCAVSATNAKIGQKVTLTANVNPYNAGYTTVEWFVNDSKVDGANTLSYEFSADKAGEYKIYCKVDGIKSTVKTVTVKADEQKPQPEENKGCFGVMNVAGVTVLALIAVATAAATMLVAKRKED